MDALDWSPVPYSARGCLEGRKAPWLGSLVVSISKLLGTTSCETRRLGGHAMRKTAVLSALDLEFNRLARQFDNLIRQYVEHPSIDHSTPSPQILLQIIRARRARADYFRSDLFSDQTWDILLDRLNAQISKQNVCKFGVRCCKCARDDGLAISEFVGARRACKANPFSLRWPSLFRWSH